MSGSAPYSRHQPEFTKKRLEHSLREGPYRYVFMGRELGGMPRDPALLQNGRPDYQAIERSEPFRHGLARLVRAHEQDLSICLMCAEGKPAHCHRTRLIGHALEQRGIALSHILPDGSLATQQQVTGQDRQKRLPF